MHEAEKKITLFRNKFFHTTAQTNIKKQRLCKISQIKNFKQNIQKKKTTFKKISEKLLKMKPTQSSKECDLLADMTK